MWDGDWAYGMHHWMWFMWFPFGGLWSLLIFVLIVRAIFWPRSYRHWRYRYGMQGSALDLLEQRYARGEIGRDEYLEKKRDLMG